MIVLIAGVSGGLGPVLAKRLQEEGMTVYGTARNAETHQKRFDFPTLSMDVKDQASVQNAIDEVVGNEGRIDILINCINEMIIGTVEEMTDAELLDVYNTNPVGLLRLAKAVLPQMKKQGGGTIMTLSSAGGLLAVPTMSAYTSSKHALQVMAEAIQHEVRRFNIAVTIMQPVALKLDRPALGAHLGLVNGVTDNSISHAMVKRMAMDTEKSPLTPEMVSEKIVQVLKMKKKPLKVPMDRAKGISMMKRIMPQSFFDKLLGGLVDSLTKHAEKV